MFLLMYIYTLMYVYIIIYIYLYTTLYIIYIYIYVNIAVSIKNHSEPQLSYLFTPNNEPKNRQIVSLVDGI